MAMPGNRMILVFMFGALAVIFAIFAVVFENLAAQTDSELDPISNMTDAEIIGKNKVKNAVTGEIVTVESFWESQPAVITFFRRWGCAFCRVAALDLSAIKEDLDANNVRLIGIGVEDLGKEEFIAGNFFKGELYVDEEKQCYKDLKYKRYGMMSLIPAMVVKTSRDAISKARSENVGGDMKGDYYQVGGTLVVSTGGDKVLLSQKQQSLADHVDPNEVLKSLGLPTKDLGAKAEAQCDLKGESKCE